MLQPVFSDFEGSLACFFQCRTPLEGVIVSTLDFEITSSVSG